MVGLWLLQNLLQGSEWWSSAFCIVTEFGGPVNGSGALQEAQRALLGISHSYSRESCTVVGYDASKVSIPSAGATAVPLVDVLSGRAKAVLENFEQHMMKDDADLCIASESFIWQYTDIKLSKSKKHNSAFHKRLFDAGLLRPVDRGRGYGTPLFVKGRRMACNV